MAGGWTVITFESKIFGTNVDCNNCNGIPYSQKHFVGALAKGHLEIVWNMIMKPDHPFGHWTRVILYASEAVCVVGKIRKKLEEVPEKSRP
jgi:hypothetical protein